MIVSRRVAVVCALGAATSMCGERHNSFTNAGGAQGSSTQTSTLPPCSDSPFTIDGLFTGYTPPTANTATISTPTYEWAGISSVRGKFTYMYMSSCSTGSADRLNFINDWYTNAVGPIAAKCYNRFDFFDPASTDAIELRVYGDHHVEVYENGTVLSVLAKGAAGFGSSPNVTTPHSMFEFVFDLPWKYQSVQMSPSDPCGSTPPPTPPPPLDGPTPPSVGVECEDPSFMIDEPVTAQLAFNASGVAATIAPNVPRASGLDKFDATSGDRVVLRGRSFGTTTGHVTVGGIDAQVLMWTDSRIQIVVPSGVSPNAKTQISNDGWSVAGPRIVGPTAPAN